MFGGKIVTGAVLSQGPSRFIANANWEIGAERNGNISLGTSVLSMISPQVMMGFTALPREQQKDPLGGSSQNDERLLVKQANVLVKQALCNMCRNDQKTEETGAKHYRAKTTGESEAGTIVSILGYRRKSH